MVPFCVFVSAQVLSSRPVMHWRGEGHAEKLGVVATCCDGVSGHKNGLAVGISVWYCLKD